MALEPFPKRTNVADPPMRRVDAPSTPNKDVQPASQNGRESAEPTSQKGPEKVKLCWCCKKLQIKPPVYMCRPCKTVYRRVWEAKKLMDQGAIEIWDKFHSEVKAEFYILAEDLRGRDLVATLQIFVGVMQSSRRRDLKTTLQILVAKMYKHNPAQLGYILKKTRKMFCPRGEAPLYEDMQYESNFKAEETRREKRQMNSSEDASIRPPKKPKAEPTKRE